MVNGGHVGRCKVIIWMVLVGELWGIYCHIRFFFKKKSLGEASMMIYKLLDGVWSLPPSFSSFTIPCGGRIPTSRGVEWLSFISEIFANNIGNADAYGPPGPLAEAIFHRSVNEGRDTLKEGTAKKAKSFIF
jgi:hypothetical protein